MAGLAADPLIESLEVEEEMEAAEDPGLITRPRRGRAEQNGLEDAEDHERRSVYLDSAEGVGSPKGSETKESTPIADVERRQEYHPDSEKKLGFANGFHTGDNHKITEQAERQEYNPESEKILEFEKGLPTAEDHTITEKAENLAGPESIKRQRADPSQSEVKNDVPIREINDIKEEVAEYDVEKVLEEQETHDLFCPNCHSCITKRVILRKRKRIGKPLEGESQGQKRQIVGPNVHSDAVNPSTPNPTQESEVFRCLSCFSFFIPTASGFKLFRIFGRKEEGASLQSPSRTPAQDLNSVGLTSPLLTTEFADSGSQLQRDPQLSNAEQATNDVLASSNLETGLNSQRNVDIIKKVESSTKQNANGFQFFRIFGWRHEDHSLKISHEETVPQANSDRTTPDDVGISKSPAEESDGRKPSTPLGQGNSLPKIAHLSNGKPANIDPSVGDNHALAAAGLKTGLVGQSKIKGNDSKEHVGDTLVKAQHSQSNIANNIVDGVINGAFSASYTENTKNNYILNQLQAEVPIKGLLDKDVLLPAPESDAFHHDEYQANSGLKLETKITEIDPTTHSDISVARVKIPLEGSEKMPLVSFDHLAEETKIGVEKSPHEEKKVHIPLKPDYSLSSANARANDVKQLDTVRQLPSPSVQVVPTPASPGLLIDEEAGLNVGQQIVGRIPRQWDILKSIVYGGLIESLTSLGVVSAAAGSNATTLNIVVMALANLVGGLIVLAHNLRELITDQRTTDQRIEDEDRYYRALGRRVNFRLHAVVAIISYIIFGMIPSITYGFSFRKSDDKDYKLMAVAGASFFCILLLATGKAHVQQSPKPYIKKIMYYLAIGLISSGLSYAVGELLRRALEKTGLFDSSTGASKPSSSATLIETWPGKTGWESY